MYMCSVAVLLVITYFYVANQALAELTAFVKRNENALPSDNEHIM